LKNLLEKKMAIDRIDNFSVAIPANATKFRAFIDGEDDKKGKQAQKNEPTPPPQPPKQNVEAKVDAEATSKETWKQWLKRQVNDFVKSGLTCTDKPRKTCDPKSDAGGW
jgi:hypothetical protein